VRRTRSLLAVTAVVGAAVALAAAPARADVPEHAVIVCQTASFYANYDSASGPSGFITTLDHGKKVGHTPGKQPVINGWAAAFDFGASQWGYVLDSCIGGYDSW
jgi:hypothetical protein